MNNVLHYIPEVHLTAAENLANFVRQCQRHSLECGYTWSSVRWLGFSMTKLGSPYGRRDEILLKNSLATEFLDFAKSYLWYLHTNNSSKGIQFSYMALRVVEKMLLQEHGSADVSLLTLGGLDRCVETILAHYSKSSPSLVSNRLKSLAVFLSRNFLVRANIKNWTCSIKTFRPMTGISAKAEAARLKKLPDERALAAVAEIFANNPSDPKDILSTCFVAMAMCAPQRGSEILSLPISAEIRVKDKNSVEQYGWRFFGLKGFEGDIKWIPSSMAGVAQTAFGRLLELCEPGRKLAAWIEDHPDEFYRHHECPQREEHEPLTATEAASALGFVVSNSQQASVLLNQRGLSGRKGANTLASLWIHTKERLPRSFPWADEHKTVKYRDALFCILRNQARGDQATIPVELMRLTRNFFWYDLGPRKTVRYHKSLFDRHGYYTESGSPLKLNTHQPRHLLNTIAQKGGMSDSLIAKWSGRANQKQNSTYNHMTDAEVLKKIQKQLTTSQPDLSGIGVLPKPKASDEDDFLALSAPAVHVTVYGFCVHNFLISPCMKYRDCLNCTEHLCIKGDDMKLARLKTQLMRLRHILDLATKEATDETYGADRWIEHHRLTISRLESLIEILESENLPDQAIVRLVGSDYSHVGRTLDAKSHEWKALKNGQALK